MAAVMKDKAAVLANLPVRPDEDPFIVAIGGFYRRWFNLLDREFALETVARSCAPLVVDDNAIVAAEHRNLRLPVTSNAVQSADENERMPLPRFLVVDLAARNRDFRHGVLPV